MTRWLGPVAIVALCSVPLRADVTITQTITSSGGAAAVSGSDVQSRIVTRIKGRKHRSDVEFPGLSFSRLTDLDAKEVYMLRPDAKTASAVPPVDASAKTGDGGVSLKATGRSRTILHVPCDEYTFETRMSMLEMVPTDQLPPEAADMLKGVRIVITGSMWVAKTGSGTDDYLAFRKAAAAAGMIAGLAGVAVDSGNERTNTMTAAAAAAPGIPYIFEMTVSVEGAPPEMAEAMKTAAGSKITSTVSAVSTDPIPDDVFQVPADYKIVK